MPSVPSKREERRYPVKTWEQGKESFHYFLKMKNTCSMGHQPTAPIHKKSVAGVVNSSEDESSGDFQGLRHPDAWRFSENPNLQAFLMAPRALDNLKQWCSTSGLWGQNVEYH